FLVSCFIRRSHLTSTLFPYTTLFRSAGLALLICFSFLNQTQHLHDLLTKKRIEQSKLELDVFLALCTNRNILDLAADSFFDHLEDRKSTRLNSSHVSISYAVFCLKKK